MSASFRITIGFMLRSNLQFLHNFRCKQLFSRRCKMSATVEALTNDILDFWFLPSDNEGFGKMRFAWFKKDEAFDQLICSKYLYLIESAITGDLKAEWNSNPRSALAHLLLLDQFTRNIFRGTPKSLCRRFCCCGMCKVYCCHWNGFTAPTNSPPFCVPAF